MEMQSSSDHEAPDTSSVPPPPPPSDGAPLQDHALLPQSIEHPQDWEKLKGMLSWWLKKVLSEYPEAKMTDEQQKKALGETYSQLVNRLDEDAAEPSSDSMAAGEGDSPLP